MSPLIRGSQPPLDRMPETPGVYAARAARAYAAMQRRFRTRDVLYRRDGKLRLPGTAAHLWPFSRALVATLDLAGIAHDLTADIDADAAVAASLKALERYWDPSGDPPAYSSDVRGARLGGDRYYDDNAWVGLALVQLERMRPGSGYLDRAEELFRFAASSGWDRRAVPNPGGVFWVEQGRGAGTTNHDRNTVSNAPNAELGLHLAELRDRRLTAPESIVAEEMYEWVLATLDASRESDLPGTGLFWDKLRGDGTLDKTLWSYNQGSMDSVTSRARAGEEAALRDRVGQDRLLKESLERQSATARAASVEAGGELGERGAEVFRAGLGLLLPRSGGSTVSATARACRCPNRWNRAQTAVNFCIGGGDRSARGPLRSPQLAAGHR